jgi:hypothetical protein
VTAARIAPGLETIILKCLAKKPADRFASATALRHALLALGPLEWDVGQARQWWSDFRAIEQQVDAATERETMTMSVDLEHHRESFLADA